MLSAKRLSMEGRTHQTTRTRRSYKRLLAWARSDALDAVFDESDPIWFVKGAFAGKRPLGIIGCSADTAYALLSILYIDLGHNRTGIGAALIAHAMSLVHWMIGTTRLSRYRDGNPRLRNSSGSVRLVSILP